MFRAQVCNIFPCIDRFEAHHSRVIGKFNNGFGGMDGCAVVCEERASPRTQPCGTPVFSMSVDDEGHGPTSTVGGSNLGCRARVSV